MRLKGIRSSRNVEERGRRRGGGRAGIGGVGLLIVLALGYFAGIDVTPLLQQLPQDSAEEGPITPEEQQAREFAKKILGSTEMVWEKVFPDQLGVEYAAPTVVLYSGVTESPCGDASGATGPFYCPLDARAYVDTDFFAVLSQQLGARGDFAAAYVIAHEVAHHVQNEMGILGEVNQARQRASGTEANALTVRLELQADCLSGVWASGVDGFLEPGDVAEALEAARRIGDDYLARRAGKVPQPHTFTHGTSEQRARWFATGYRAGRIDACDTFGARSL